MQKAFSIAEAMITLLIISLALAAAAPIMSRQIKSDNTGLTGVPINAIMFFDLRECPNGWERLTASYPNAGGAFLRNLGEDTALTGEERARTRGSYQRAAVQNIRAQFSGVGQTFLGAGAWAATLRGAVFRVNNVNTPVEGVKVFNDGASSDDFFGFDASAYDSSADIATQNNGGAWTFGVRELGAGHTTVYSDAVKEVRPDNMAFLACKKIR